MIKITNKQVFAEKWADFFKERKYSNEEMVLFDKMQELNFGPPKFSYAKKDNKKYIIYWPAIKKYLNGKEWVNESDDAYHYKLKSSAESRRDVLWGMLQHIVRNGLDHYSKAYRHNSYRLPLNSLPDEIRNISGTVSCPRASDFLTSVRDTPEWYEEMASYRRAQLDYSNNIETLVENYQFEIIKI